MPNDIPLMSTVMRRGGSLFFMGLLVTKFWCPVHQKNRCVIVTRDGVSLVEDLDVVERLSYPSERKIITLSEGGWY